MAKDIFNNTLTDYGVLTNSSVIFTDYGEPPTNDTEELDGITVNKDESFYELWA